VAGAHICQADLVEGDVWEVGTAYEAYVGRWSREVAAKFVDWLAVPPGRRWLDAGCGTGALTAAVPAPATVIGVDRSRGFLAGRIGGAGAGGAGAGGAGAGGAGGRAAVGGLVVGDAGALPFADAGFEVVVSGLALNFVPRPEAAVAEFARVAAPGATVASYVWDYADGMRMMRLFWDAATDIDRTAADRDEGRRFPICRPEALAAAWTTAGLRGFDDFWQPFLGGQGAAPAYLASLPVDHREAIRERLHARLGERTIALTAAAWAVRGFKDV
jgi:SAM-dependent methyltransferase